MARHQPVYVCSSCGGESLKWQGQCPHCSEWNTLTRLMGARAPALASAGSGPPPLPVALSAPGAPEERFSLGSGELDRVFGGGLGVGSVCLLGGEPGHRQVDAAAAGRRRRGARARGALRLGRGVDAADRAARTTPRAERAAADAAQRQLAGIDPGAERRAPRRIAGGRFDPDPAGRQRGIGPGLAAAAARVHGGAGAFRQAERHRRDRRRPRDQGWRDRGTEAARAPGRYGAVFRCRCRQPLPHAAGHQEPLWTGG